MNSLWEKVGAGLTAVLIALSITTAVQGQPATGVLHIKGRVLCAGCAFDALRATASVGRELYQLRHERGQVVVDISSVNAYPAWRSFSWPHEIHVRASDELFHRLSAEENLFKDVEITGLLSTTKVLDIFDVTVHG